jgi:alpha-N-arabinofuranosidase
MLGQKIFSLFTLPRDSMQRRDFLKTSMLAGSALLFPKHSFAATADAHIEVLVNEPIATIAPEIYGHFIEHLGGVIYDGVWVGESSRIPNVHGIRRELIARLKAIKAPVVRWPGGCFADSYDWKDGIGPRDKRPRRTNFWVDEKQAQKLPNTSVQKFEPNTFGTDEFIQFCKLSNAEPYIAANLRSLPPLSFDQWVEYCNSPAHSTTYADIRAAAGAADPYNVRYWGIGNESWGCGGNFTPEEYANEYRRFTAWVPDYGAGLRYVASGSNQDDVDWTTEFFESILHRRPIHPPFGWSVHNYTSAVEALDFNEQDAYALFYQGTSTEQIIQDMWMAMGVYDREHRTRLVVDEYGPWYGTGTEVDPTHIFGQQITMRDAIVTAFTLDIFNRHAEKVCMANCAQLINCIDSLFLAHEDKFVSTPNFYVFEMYAAHQGAQAVRAEFAAPSIGFTDLQKPDRWGPRREGARSVQRRLNGLMGSASMNGKQLTLTVVNPHLTEPRETEIVVRGGSAGSASATVLAAADIHAHNTFAQPDAVSSKRMQATASGSTVSFTFPPMSVTKLEITLS